jgi:endonuclease/exonuclease/phosphatase family metal-dependent hydrolase
VRWFALFFWFLSLAGGQTLTVASLNIAMVEDPNVIAQEIRTAPNLSNADVLLLQEVVNQNHTSVAEAVARQLGREAAFASPDGVLTKGGLAILSRHPIADQRVHQLKPQNLVFRSRKRIALAATILTPDGPVRIINVHLDTRINPGERIAQLRPALDDASCFYGPSVIGGDFNTNDMQWVSNVVPLPYKGWQAARVRILMESRGYRTPFQKREATFHHLGMQLDWIYVAGLEPIGHGIDRIAFSDHDAVWTRLATRAPDSSLRTERSPVSRQGGA